MITPAVDEKRPLVPPETTPGPPSYGETWAADAASRAARPGPSAPSVHTDHATPYASHSHSHSQPELGRVESLEQDSRSAISLGPEEPASLKGSARAKSKSSGGGARAALKQGTIALVMMPVVAAAALLYGTGKFFEGVGKGLSVGPEALLKSYRNMNGKSESTNPYVNGKDGSGEGRGSGRGKD